MKNVMILVRTMIATVTLVIYLCIGYIIALLYTWASSGNTTLFWWTTILSPLAIIALHCVYKIDHEFFKHRIQWLAGKLFWTCIVWILSPIILNTISYGCNQIDRQPLGDLIFRYRFTGLWAIPIMIVVVYIGEILYDDNRPWLRSWFKRNFRRIHFARD